MTPDEELRARKLVNLLERQGPNFGLLVIDGNVVLRDGPNLTDSPTMYYVSVLKNAIELGLLQENRVSGSHNWTWWVLKPTKEYLYWTFQCKTPGCGTETAFAYGGVYDSKRIPFFRNPVAPQPMVLFCPVCKQKHEYAENEIIPVPDLNEPPPDFPRATSQ